MKVVGIIAEYNPFHNGHAFQIKKAKELCGADYALVVMSGNFVQRGEPAVMNKYFRTECALLNGADIVFELPAFFSAASAEIFAKGAVSMLKNTGVVDCICFGSETGDINVLTDICSLFTDESDDFKNELMQNMKSGLKYPAAFTSAVRSRGGADYVEDIISYPNNMLAIEYLKALKFFNWNIEAKTVKRCDNGYNNLSISEVFSSASAIRNVLVNENNYNVIPDKLSGVIPENCIGILKSEYNKSFPITANDFSSILGAKLLSMNKDELSAIYDISSDFANKIEKNKNSFSSFTSFAEGLKSKNITYNYVMRGLNHILLDIKKETMDNIIDNNYKVYGRILGFNKSTPLLSTIKSNCDMEIISKLADSYKTFAGINRQLLDLNLNSDHLYRMVAMNKFNINIPNEFQSNIIINS